MSAWQDHRSGAAALRSAVRPALYRAACWPARLRAALGLVPMVGPRVAFVIERAAWSIRHDGESICREIDAVEPGLAAVVEYPNRLAGRVVHFGSQFMWTSWAPAVGRSNRFVVSYFHGKPEDDPAMARHVDDFRRSLPRLSRVVTAARLVEERLLGWGVPREKLVRIPIGVDPRLFRPPTPEERRAARAKWNLPADAVVVGSFQKDGVGWGDGREPKAVKGPDLLVAALARLARDLPVTAFLTGPARGYVKHALEARGIPYVHAYPPAHEDLVECYHALDLYLVTSREEGGPKGVMESMAARVPLVSTPVGMAPDLMVGELAAGLCAGFEPDEIAARALALLQRSDRDRLLDSAREAVHACDWRLVAREHLEKIYRPLL